MEFSRKSIKRKRKLGGMKAVFLVVLMVFGTHLSAQTKLISYRSHSGAMEYFAKVLEAGSMDMMNHNLGAAPEPIVRMAELDSVIRIDDTTTVMVTSNVCKDRYNWEDDPIIWSEGADTLYNDPFWTSNNQDSVKQILQLMYHFRNPIDSVVFIGYPDEEQDLDIDGQDDNKQVTPPISNHKSPPGMGLPIALVLVAMVSIIIGLFSWRKAHFKKVAQGQLS